MLLLESVDLVGFRSMANAVHLPVSREMTVLTGVNDGGKTATLYAIEALLGKHGLDCDDICDGTGGPAEIVGNFSDSDGGEGLVVRVAIETDGPSRREVRRTCHIIFGHDPSAHALPRLKELMEEAGVASPGGAPKQPYVDTVESWLASRPGHEFVDEWVSIDAATAQRMPALTSYKSAATSDPENHVKTLVTQEVRRILEEDLFAERLAEVQADLANEVGPGLDDLKTKIKDYCPDVDDVEVKASYDFTRPSILVQLVLVTNGEDRTLVKSGEGKRRRITLAIHEAGLEFLREEDPVRAEVVTYDEPDTNLDYRSQRQLFGILEEQGKLGHVQVLVATHSLNFIDKVPLQSIAHYRLDEQQHTQLEILESVEFDDEIDFLGSVCAGLGLRNSVLLDERVFLMLEGETETAAMPALFRTVTGQSLVSSGVTMFNSQGSGALRKLTRAIKNEWQRQVVALLDEDQRAQSAAWITDMGLVEGDDLYFVGTKEFEDAFSDAQWMAVLNHGFQPQDGAGDWTEAEIAGLRGADKFSDALRARARQRCHDHTISKPDLGLILGAVLTVPGELPHGLLACIEAATAAAR